MAGGEGGRRGGSERTRERERRAKLRERRRDRVDGGTKEERTEGISYSCCGPPGQRWP